MKYIFKSICIALLIVWLSSIQAQAIDYKPFIDELNQKTDCCLDSVVFNQKQIHWKSSKEFEYKLCGAKVEDAYSTSREKFFVSNLPNVDKWGSFYWGLLQNKRASSIVNAIGWCESGYNPKIVSPDGGYGIFQITPAAIGDKHIIKSKLLQPEYNTQYGLSHMHKFFKSAQDKYSGYNTSKDPEFDWWMMSRGYNGGFKQIDNVVKKTTDDDKMKNILTGDFIESSKISGRFVCYEKVNVVYPLKIQLTSETLMKKAF